MIYVFTDEEIKAFESYEDAVEFVKEIDGDLIDGECMEVWRDGKLRHRDCM